MHASVFAFIQWTWGITGIVWLAAALASKRSVRKQSAGSRIVHVAMMVLGFGLIFGDPLAVGPLAWRLLPAWPPIAWASLALTVIGCAFAIWARLLLGRNWSGTVTVKEDHQLMRTGPYAIVATPSTRAACSPYSAQPSRSASCGDSSAWRSRSSAGA